MRCFFIILLMGLNACAKKNMVKPEALPPEAKIYIEKFQSGEEPEQWGIFTNGENDPKKILEQMKSEPAYSNQIIKALETL